jgi:AcrR family transcriptional regulator
MLRLTFLADDDMALSATMQAGSKQGRPRQADPHRVSQVALRLFERNGFDSVTMDQIAKAASVSRRTLFRLFPSKSDLVWVGLHEVRDALQVRAASLSGPGLRLDRLVDELFVPVLRQLDDPEAARIARRRLRLVAGAPALLEHPVLREIEETVATTLKGGARRDGAPPSLVARTVVGATFAALLWWAQHGKGMSALETARAALRAIAVASGA